MPFIGRYRLLLEGSTKCSKIRGIFKFLGFGESFCQIPFYYVGTHAPSVLPAVFIVYILRCL